MTNILVAGKNEAVCDGISELLTSVECRIVALTDGAHMRSIDASLFDVIIISTPLSDEFGLDLAAELKDKTAAGLIVLAKGEIADEVQQKLRFTGAFVLGRPVSKSVLIQTVKFTQVARENITRVNEEKEKLTQELADLKLINRAKSMLMQYLKLTEAQAHRHIQKQAMDLRKTQREVAEDILRTYSS